MTQVFIEATSYRRQNGKWIPQAVLFVNEGDQTRVVPYVWLNQECENRDGADFYARFASKRYLIKNGFKKEDLFS